MLPHHDVIAPAGCPARGTATPRAATVAGAVARRAADADRRRAVSNVTRQEQLPRQAKYYQQLLPAAPPGPGSSMPSRSISTAARVARRA